MKLKIATLFLLCICLSCNNDDDERDNNPYLQNPVVSLNLNLNLPEYTPLQFPGNHIIINSQGIRGIVIYNINNELYTAFDLSDPNHVPNDCSRMEIEGVLASCPCTTDSNEYDIITGLHTADENLYPMQQYRVERSGDEIFVSN